jgi:hypothetical protein
MATTDDIEAFEESQDYSSIASALGSAGDDEEVAEACCDSLLRLCSSVEKPTLLQVSWAALVATVEAFGSDAPSVVEVALSVLAKLAPSLTEATNSLFTSSNLVAVLASTMDENDSSESTLIEQCCLLLAGLGANNAALLKDAGFLDKLEEAREKITNERNKKYVDEALAVINK